MTVSRPVAFIVRLTAEEHEELKARALANDMTMAQVVRAALRAWLTKN